MTQKLTTKQIEKLAQFAHQQKGPWYAAAQSTIIPNVLQEKAKILISGFRDLGVDVLSVVPQGYDRPIAVSTPDNTHVTITDQPEVGFAVANVIGVLTESGEAKAAFEKSLSDVQNKVPVEYYPVRGFPTREGNQQNLYRSWAVK